MSASIPLVSGGGRPTGNLMELRRRPLELLGRVRRECGQLGRFRMLGRDVVLMSGPRAQEAFFRAADEQLDPQPTSNELMRPIFGEGVVYDLPPERRRETLRTPALRDENLRGSAEIIARETERMVAGLGESGEMDLLDFTTELTIYTSSACLIGREFREQLGPEFAHAYHDLERGTDAVGFLNSGLDTRAFRTRDRARERLVTMIEEIIGERRSGGADHEDMLAVLLALEKDGKPRFSVAQITGILVSTMFAGHHTSSATSAWTLIELLRHPREMERVRAELEHLYADGREVSYQALREMPQLENSIKETLRLHPPLIMLLRTALEDFPYNGSVIEKGSLVAASLALSHRDEECFVNAAVFEPDRYDEPRREDRRHPWAWIPFGGGPHRCLGANFAAMQLKAIFSILLRACEFELAAAPERYTDDHTRMVVLPRQPCPVRYRRLGV